MTDATCACGQLRATLAHPPKRASICHCEDCRKRSGSAFSLNARYAPSEVETKGRSSSYTRKGDEGSSICYHFCPDCGVVVWYLNDQIDAVLIPVGTAVPAELCPPVMSVYDERRPEWLRLEGEEIVVID